MAFNKKNMEIYSINFAQKTKEIFLTKPDGVTSEDLRFKPDFADEKLKVKLSEGEVFYDIIRFQDPYNFAISERVLNVLIENNLSGWSCCALDIDTEDKLYYSFQVLSKVGELERPLKAGFIIGCKFDRNTLDGSDFFYPEGTLSLFCSERVKKIFEKEKVTNIKFVNITKERWYSVGKKTT